MPDIGPLLPGRQAPPPGAPTPPGAANTGNTTAAIQAATWLHNAGFTGNDLVTAVAIAGAESSWNPNPKPHANRDGSVDYGLMQINSSNHPTAAEQTDGQANANKAFALYSARHGFADWSTYTSGKYLMYLPAAQKAVTNAQANGYAYNANNDKGLNIPGVPAVPDLSSIMHVFANLGSGEFWKRVGLGAGAVLLLMFGVVIMIESNSTIRKASAVAATV